MVSEAATQYGQAGLRYFIADRYVRAFQALASAPNTRLVVVPMESSALAGGIVQAMQLFRGDDGTPGGGPTGYAAATATAATAVADRAAAGAAGRRDACGSPVGSRHPGMSDWIIWVVAGLVLLMLEIHAPGAFMMWLGLAACGTGLVVLLSGIGFELQVVTFAVLAAISLAIGLRFRHRRPPRMNTQQAGLAGRSATALIIPGSRRPCPRRRQRLGGPRADRCRRNPRAGSRLRVEGVDGTVLIVRPEG